MAINDNKPSTMKWARSLTKCIKIVSSMFLLTEIVFLAVIGEFSMSCRNQPNGEHVPGPTCDVNSMDYWVFQKYPAFYSKMEFLGFRMQQDPSKNISVDEWQTLNSSLMQTKFYSLIAYFMVALYLNNYFDQKI